MEPAHGLPLDVQAHREDGGQRAPLQPGVRQRQRCPGIAGQIEEERRGPALEQDPEQARGQGHVGLADAGDAGTRFEHRLEVIGLAVGVDHRDIAALKVQEPLEPPGQLRPHGLGLLGARQPGQHVHQEGLAAGIQPGQPGARRAPAVPH